MIHKTSIIEDGAKIAEDVVIGPFCTIGKDVELRSGVILESNVILQGKLKVCKNSRIFSFTVIGHEKSNIDIGKNTHIREFTQVGSQKPLSGKSKKIRIGANNFIMAYTQIQSGVTLGDYCILTNAVKVEENVKCEERVIIGGLSTIEANNTIGTGVMIGGASYVNHDMPPFTLVEGNKASIKGLNLVGLRRRLENKDDIEEIKSIFKKIFSNEVDKDYAAKVADEHENEYVKRFAKFIATSNI